MSDSEPTPDAARSARQRNVLAQAIDLIRRRELRVLGALPRRGWRRPVASSDPPPRTTLVKTTSTINAEADAAFRALAEMFSDPKMRSPRYHRYVLVEREAGELVFEHDPTCALVDEAIADACGLPKVRPRVIRLAPQPAARAKPRMLP
jgi:hypothetical protein